MRRAFLVPMRAALAGGLASAALFGTLVVWRSLRALRSAVEAVRAEHEIRFIVRPFLPTFNTGFEPVSSPSIFQQAARFQDHLFLAGPAGLLEYDSSGSLLHQYAAGVELPGSPLIGLAQAVLADASEPELILATANHGLLAFNGRSFRQIIMIGTEARALTAILPTASGHLLVGTKKRGVLVYDGKRLTILHPTLDGIYVTGLAGDESDLWVGTLAHGVLHFHSGVTESFTESQGLPDQQVECLAISGDSVYVGTATGVAVFSRGRFSRVLAPGVLATALLATPRLLYVGSEDQGVIVIPLEGQPTSHPLGLESPLAEVRQLFASGDMVYAVARGGLYRLSPHAFGWQRVRDTGGTLLTDRNVSALAADSEGRLWVGYFDRGLDLLTANGRVTHIEDPHVFCVNRIFVDTRSGTIDVATANGLVRFNSSGSEQQVLTRADGLIADHVTDVAAYRDGLVLATPAGLTFIDASGTRSMYAFHGLVNNHVYALGVSGDELMAGTLGGLSRLKKGYVEANFTTASSNLKHNWITALVPVGPDWMVGTYGAGIVSLDHFGHFRPFEIGSGKFEVNPNAMLVTSACVLAGTLGQGLYVYHRQSGRWSVIHDGLPSSNVTAVAHTDGYFYIGTDNGLVRIPEQKLEL